MKQREGNGVIHCRRLTDNEIRNWILVYNVKIFAAGLGVSPSGMHEYLVDEYCRFEGEVWDENGRSVYLDLSVFEATDEELDLGLGEAIGEKNRIWFRDSFAKKPVFGTRPHVRIEAWEKFRVAGTILRCRNPVAASMWTQLPIAANDNINYANDNDPE